MKLTVTWATSPTDLAKPSWLPTGKTEWENVDGDSICYPGGRLLTFRHGDGSHIALQMFYVHSVEVTP